METTKQWGAWRICIGSDLKLGMSSEVVRFSDDLKLFRVVKTRADCEALHKVSMLWEWAIKWQVMFSVGRYKVM